jgi:signal transduction histidine kinase
MLPLDLGLRRAALAVPVGLLGLLLLASVSLDSMAWIGRPMAGFLFWDNGTLVSFHLDSWTGPRGGLPLNGGRIVSVDGAPFESGAALVADVAGRPAGSELRYGIRWRGALEEHRIRSMRLGGGDYVGTFGVYLLNGFAFLAIAVLALALRPDLPAARGLALASLAMGGLLTLTIDYFVAYRWVRLYPLIEALTPAALASFGLVFPVARLGARRRRALVLALVGLGLCLGVANLSLFRAEPEFARRITYAVYILIAGIGIATVLSFGEVLLRAPDPQLRVRAAVVFAGGLVAIFLPAIAVLAFFLLGWVVSFSWITVLLPLFPSALIYAVLRHDLLQAERFARLTIAYGLTSAAVVAGYAIAVAGVEGLVSREAGSGPIAWFLLALAAALGFDPLRRRLQRTVDRLFYRSSLDPAAELEVAGQELAELSDEGEIVRCVEARLRDALGVSFAQLALRNAPVSHDAVLEAPVTYRETPLGLLACGAKLSGAPFSAAERMLLDGIAAQTALALRTAQSVRELRAAQSQLVQSERLAAIGELAGAVAHGIRNPLAGIRAIAQGALELDALEAGEESMRDILHEVDRLDQRVATLLDFSRPFEPNPRPCDLAAVVRSVESAVSRRAARAGASVRVEVPSEPLVVELDPDHVEEALLELAGNALRVLGQGGVLTLEAHREGDGVVLRVRDDGPGIPEAVQQRIFEPFFTTRAEGTGMGLATVRKLVERQGGRVDLEASGPEGTCFRLWLPSP